jgi:hypothetical protein
VGSGREGEGAAAVRAVEKDRGEAGAEGGREGGREGRREGGRGSHLGSASAMAITRPDQEVDPWALMRKERVQGSSEPPQTL